jgi:hypothetical protein
MPRTAPAEFLSPERRRLLPFALAAGVALQGCAAHFPRRDEPVELMEPITVGFPIAQGQLLEAQLPLHVFFVNGLDRPDALDERGFATTLSFSFLAKIRMYDGPSSPVRTPSYMPRLKLQLIGVEPVGGADGARGDRLLGVLELYLAHHSNGQDGCALRDQERGTGFSDFDCAPLTSPPSEELNLRDGSFTTQIVGANLGGRWLAFPSSGGLATMALTAALGAEWNVPCRFTGCMEPQMRSRYGEVVLGWRASGDLLAVRDFNRTLPLVGNVGMDARVRASAYGKVHVGLGSGRSPFGNAAFELAWLPRYRRDLVAGPFVRYRTGRDDLNIRFEERLDEWVVGFLVDFAAPETLRRPPAHPRISSSWSSSAI